MPIILARCLNYLQQPIVIYRCGSPCCTAWLIVTAILLLAVAIAFPVAIQNFIHHELHDNIVLE